MNRQNRLALVSLSAFIASLVSGCVVSPAPAPAAVVRVPTPANTAPHPNYNYNYKPAPPVMIVAPTQPPPLRQEVIVVQPSPQHVWVPGSWSWRNGWVWVPGHWKVPPRPGARWYGPSWVPAQGGWQNQPGGWR